MTGASTYSGVVDNAFFFILGTSVVLLVGVTAVMIFFAVRYSRKRNPVASQIHGSVTLETIWTVIPTILVLIMFWYGWTGFRVMRDVPEGAMEVNVTARMWSWLFEYPGGQASAELVVPVDQPVKLNLRSEDVIHSFYVPAFRIKEDANPASRAGKENYLWFQADKIGEYNIFCAEYCGDQHSKMLSKVRVLGAADYQSWLSNPRGDQDILKLKGCMACHSLDGGKLVGPTFKGLFGRKEAVLSDGQERQIVADEAYIRKSISLPNADVVLGYQPVMPPQSLTEEETVQIIERLRALR